MKRFFSLAFLLAFSAAAFAEGASAGGAYSVFIPENLYKHGNGTIAFEQGLSTALGFGSILSIPIGFTYHSTDGYVLEHASARNTGAPAFYGDSIIPYLMLKAKVPIGPVFYLEAFAGGALNWAFSMKPTGDFAGTLATASSQRIAADSVSIDKKLGFGWLAGAAAGVKIGAVSVDLGATYRYLTTPVSITANIYRVDGSTASAETVRLDNAYAVLSGISVKLGGSFSF